MTTVRIFVSSPGDVAEEREKVRRVVEALGRFYGLSVNLRVLMWEDLALDIDISAQERIERELVSEDKVPDIAIFILWSRLGSELSEERTPRPGGGHYRSGTEHEFELMLAARERTGGAKPHILAYWRQDEESFVELLRREGPERYDELLKQKGLARHFIEERFMDDKGRNVRGLVIYGKPVSFAQRLHSHLRQKIEEIAGVGAGWGVTWGANPYRGLQYFDLEHAPIFRGREEETCCIVETLREREAENCAFLVIVGASGSGKSSLARAGVAATLSQGGFDETVSAWRTVAFLPSTLEGDLFEGFAASLSASVPELSVDRTSFAERLRRNPQAAAELFASAVNRSAGKDRETFRVLIVIDQMEELWTDARVSDETREAFFASLGALAGEGGAWVLATLRSDFYGEAQRSAGFLALKGRNGHFDVAPPGPVELLRIIGEPARLAGARFETDPRTGRSLDRAILKDASADVETLPLLQYALAELFERRARGTNELTFSAYEEMGGVEGALARRIEDLCAEFSDGELEAMERIFPLLVTLDAASGGSEARRRARVEDLVGDEAGRSVFEALVRARFLTTDQIGGDAVVSLAHEALLRCWGRLAAWIDRNRGLLRLRAGAEHSFSSWENHGHDPSLLLSEGLALEEGRCLLQDGSEFVPAQLGAYIRESIAQQEIRARKRTALRRRVVGVIVGALVVGLVGSTWQAVRASRAEQSADISERASRARLLSQSSPTDGLALALDTVEKEASLRGLVSPAVLSSLLHALEAGKKIGEFRESNMVSHSLFSPDGKQIHFVAGSKLTTVDRNSGLTKSSDPSPGSSILRIAMDAEGKHLLLADNGGKLTMVRSGGHEVVWKVEAHEGVASGLAYVREKGFFASCGSDGQLRFWAMDGTEAAPSIKLPVDSIGAFDITPDGTVAAVVASEVHVGQGAWVVETATGTAKRLETGDDILRTIAFDAVGLRLAGAGTDRTIRLWDRKGENLGIRIRTSHAASITALAFHPYEPWLLSGDEEGGIHAYREDGESPFPPLERHLEQVKSLGFDATGTLALSGSNDFHVRVWDMLGLQAIPPFDAGVLSRGIVFHPDGTRLAAGGLDGVVRIYDYPSGVLMAEAPAHKGLCDQLFLIPGEGGLLSAADLADEFQIVSWQGELIGKSWKAPGGPYTAAAVLPDRPGFLVLGSDGVLREVELPSFRVLSERPLVGREDVAADDLGMEASNRDGLLLLLAKDAFEARHLQAPHDLIARHTGIRRNKFRFAMTPSADLLLIGGPNLPGKNRLHLHSLPSLDLVGEIEMRSPILTMAVFDHDGTELAIGTETGELQFFGSGGEFLGPAIGTHKGEIRGGTLHPQEPVFAASAMDGYIRFWHFGREAWTAEAKRRLGKSVEVAPNAPGLLKRAAAQLLTDSGPDGSGRITVEEAGVSLVLPEGWAQFDRNALRMFQSLMITLGGPTFERMKVHRAFSRGDSVQVGLLDVPNFYLISNEEFSGVESPAKQIPSLIGRMEGLLFRQASRVAAAKKVTFSEATWDPSLRGFRTDGLIERAGKDPLLMAAWMIPTRNRIIFVVTVGDRFLVDEVSKLVGSIEIDPDQTPPEEEYNRAAGLLNLANEAQRKRRADVEESAADLKAISDRLAIIYGSASPGTSDAAKKQACEEALHLARKWTAHPDPEVIGRSRLFDFLFRQIEVELYLAGLLLKGGDAKGAEERAASAIALFDRPGLELSPSQELSKAGKLAALQDIRAMVRMVLGDLAGALEWQRLAVESRRRQTEGDGGANITSLLDLATHLKKLADFQSKAGDRESALLTLHEGIRELENMEMSLRSENWVSRMRDLYGSLGSLHRDKGNADEELKALRKRVVLSEELAKVMPLGRDGLWAMAQSRIELANRLIGQEKIGEGISELKRSLAEFSTLLPKETDAARITATSNTHLYWTFELLRVRRSEEGLPVLLQIIAMRERTEALRGWPVDPSQSSPLGWIALGGFLSDLGRKTEAEGAFVEGIARAEASGQPILLYEVQNRLRTIFESRADWVRAEEFAEKTWRTAREGGLGWRIVQGARAHATRNCHAKRYREAETIALAAWDLAQKEKWEGEPARLRIELARCLVDLYGRWHGDHPEESRAAAALRWAEIAYTLSPLEASFSDITLDIALQDRFWRMAVWIDEGKLEDYGKERSRVLKLAGNRTHPGVAAKAARLSLMLPTEGAELAEATRLARLAFEAGGGEKSEFLDFFGFGLSLVRNGRAGEALTMIERRTAERPTDNPGSLLVLRALALSSLPDQSSAAEEVFRKIEANAELTRQLSSLGEPYFTFLRVLLAEARRKKG